jgi:putative heme iron utilization protein
VSNYTGAGKEDKLKFAFMSFDEDGNGVITKAELLKILKSNHMASHDAEVARKADTIMAQADKDGDGVITFDEFVIVSKKFPNILVSRCSSACAVTEISHNCAILTACFSCRVPLRAVPRVSDEVESSRRRWEQACAVCRHKGRLVTRRHLCL